MNQAETVPNREAGFTLLEALVAIILLVFGLMAITNLMLVAISSNTAANHGTAAASLASQQLELLKSRDFPGATPPGVNPLAAGGDVNTSVTGFFKQDAVTGVGQFITRWQIEAVDNQLIFIRVRTQGLSPLTGPRSRAEFTTFRSCTALSQGCPTL